MLVVAGILLSLLFLNKISAPAAAVIVIDGDTIEINGQLLRIMGIDAPEPGQAAVSSKGRHDMGKISSDGLSLMIAKYARVVCEPVKAETAEDLDVQHEEKFANCYGEYDGNEDNIGLDMVAEGLAYTMFSSPMYKKEEHMASLKEVGIWGDYETRHPHKYRQAREEAGKNPLCVELGVVTSGAKIKVIDGDTLLIKGRRVRLAGIDAPELGQFGFTGSGYKSFVKNSYDVGRKTADALSAAILAERKYLFIACSQESGEAVSDDLGAGERFVAACMGMRPGRDEDIGRWLVTEGLAWSVSEKYRAAENISRGSNRNIWKRDANIRDLPWTYRKKYVTSDAGF